VSPPETRRQTRFLSLELRDCLLKTQAKLRPGCSVVHGSCVDKEEGGDAYLQCLVSLALAFTCGSARHTLYNCYDKERYRLHTEFCVADYREVIDHESV
jgi:hypothetical protein